MKILLTVIALGLAGFIAMHFLHSPINGAATGEAGHGNFLHGAGNGENSEAVTFSIRQNDRELCSDQFWVDLYDLTVKEFAVGVDEIALTDYESSVFAHVRTSENFPYGDREAWVDHIKAIPEQLIDIVREDSTVLDSCANFSVALVGPP